MQKYNDNQREGNQPHNPGHDKIREPGQQQDPNRQPGQNKERDPNQQRTIDKNK